LIIAAARHKRRLQPRREGLGIVAQPEAGRQAVAQHDDCRLRGRRIARAEDKRQGKYCQ
jgi:hypothetical protein